METGVVEAGLVAASAPWDCGTLLGATGFTLLLAAELPPPAVEGGRVGGGTGGREAPAFERIIVLLSVTESDARLMSLGSTTCCFCAGMAVGVLLCVAGVCEEESGG